MIENDYVNYYNLKISIKKQYVLLLLTLRAYIISEIIPNSRIVGKQRPCSCYEMKQYFTKLIIIEADERNDQIRI